MPPDVRPRSRTHLLPIFMIAVAGALAAGGTWYAASQADEARVRGVLELRAEWRTRDLERKLRQSHSSVQALAKLVGAQDGVDRELLQRFVDNTRTSTDPTRRLGWAARVIRDQTGQPRVFGRPDLPVSPITEQQPDGKLVSVEPRAEHFPIVVESTARDAPPLLGFDVVSRADERSVAYRARDKAQMISTPPEAFVTTSELGYVVYVPVYWGAGKPDSVEARRSRLRGFAFGTYLVSDVLEAAFQDTPSIVETIRFRVPSAGSTPVAEYRPDSGIGLPQTRPPADFGQVEITRSFDVVGQEWILHFSFSRHGVQALRSAAPMTWLIVGLLATAFLVLFLLGERGRKLRVEALVFERTAELNEATARLGAALGNISHGLAMFDKDRKLLVCNARYVELYDLPSHLAITGATQAEILQYRVDSGMYAVGQEVTYVQEVMEASTGAKKDRVDQLADGRVIVVSQRSTGDGGWVSTHEDITERRRVEAQIEHMARPDALTDLPNRVLFRARLDEALTRLPRGQGASVLCLDLDRFKSVNDTLGHPIGDVLLRSVAGRLRACVRACDTVARLGGDEFAIIQLGVFSAPRPASEIPQLLANHRECARSAA